MLSEILIVFVAYGNSGRRKLCGLRGGDGRVGKVEHLDALQIAADGLCAEGHSAIDGDRDEGRSPAFDIAGEARRDLDGGGDGAAL